MPSVQNDHVVEQIPTHTSDPTLGDAFCQVIEKK
jgi:hypothetical protein